jgi:tetratricopeptide (TPR) repeat protein
VKDRVVSTFQQTLALYKQGRKDEVVAGCSLILQMDPSFDPAKKLLEKTRNPALPIDVDALMPAAPSDARPLLDQAREALAARDFQRVIHLTSEILSDDLMNEPARLLGDEAREKLEAAPFIDQFVRKCEANIAASNLSAAKADLVKARALDDTHPEVMRLGKIISGRQTAPHPAVVPPALVPPTAAAPPSFVVDDAARNATGRSASQASDFGFTFEEEKPREVSFANFSFDSPADSPFAFGGTSAPKPPPAGDFDFSTASVATSPDDQQKIEQYLTDGDRAFDAGDHQQAIDLWSRIFLIDVTNDQASERIERAKAKRREVETKVDALIATGTTAMDRKDATRARSDFSEALRLDPNNANAREYLEELNRAGEAPPAVSSGNMPSSFDDNKIDVDFFEDEFSGIEAPLMPPPPGSAAAAARDEEAAKKKKKAAASVAPRKLPVGALLAVLGILVLSASVWYAWKKNFANKPEETTTTTSDAVFARAKLLAGRGKYDEAMALLGDIKASDPQHDAALVMIADLQQKKSGAAAIIDGKPAAQYYDEKVAAAREAFARHDFVASKQAFEEAQRVKPLPPDAKAQYDTAANQAAQLDAAKKLFTEQRYDEAISNLQPILAQDPQNANVQRMIVDAHFNLGAKALQEEKTGDAVTQFDEVLKVNPNDDLAKRSRELALRYDKQTKDLLYRIYVKYLPLRQAA